MQKKINYNSFSHSTGKDTGSGNGTYPQLVVDSDTYKNDLEPFYKKINTSSFPEEKDIHLNVFEIVHNANITDVLSCASLSKSIGLFVNEKVKLVIEKFELSSCKFYPLQIDGVQKGKGILDYYFIHILDDMSIINYPESEFYDVIPDDEPLVKIESYQEILEKNRTKKFGITPKKFVLNRTPDLFRIVHTTEIFISDKLKTELENANLTGIKIEPYTHKDFLHI
jgi:hypothetical protein